MSSGDGLHLLVGDKRAIKELVGEDDGGKLHIFVGEKEEQNLIWFHIISSSLCLF